MSIIAKDTGGKDFDPIPEGQHHAICYGVADLGTQEHPVFGNTQHKVAIVWEVPNERIIIEGEDGPQDLPRAQSRIYTLSLHQKAILRHHLESWRGKSFTSDELKNGFDLKKLLGVNCMLQILHEYKEDGKKYSRIATVTPYSGKKATPENDVWYYSMAEHGGNIPKDIPQWIQDKISESKEWSAPEEGDKTVETEWPPDDEIPF